MEEDKGVPLTLKENAFMVAIMLTGIAIDAFLIYYVATKVIGN